MAVAAQLHEVLSNLGQIHSLCLDTCICAFLENVGHLLWPAKRYMIILSALYLSVWTHEDVFGGLAKQALST